MLINPKAKRCFVVSPSDPFAVLGQGDIMWSDIEGNHTIKMDDTMCLEHYAPEMVVYWDDIQDITPYLAHDALEAA